MHGHESVPKWAWATTLHGKRRNFPARATTATLVLAGIHCTHSGKKATAHADPINTVLNSIESFATDSICRAGVPEPFNHAVINLYSVGSLMLSKKSITTIVLILHMIVIITITIMIIKCTLRVMRQTILDCSR